MYRLMILEGELSSSIALFYKKSDTTCPFPLSTQTLDLPVGQGILIKGMVVNLV